MKQPVRYVTAIALLSAAFLMGLPTHAQSLARNTDWLKKQLNKFVTDDTKHDMKLNGKKSTPTFDFKECQMSMTLDTKEDDVAIGMNIAWQLKDVRNVSYKREKDGQYTLILDVPADKMKMSMGVGGFSGSFNMNDTDKDKNSKGTNANSSFNLATKDEALVREIKEKFDESVKLCRKGKN